MLKTMIALNIIAFVSGCFNKQISSTNNNTKSNRQSHNDETRNSGFAFESYQAATEAECTNGGWKLIPRSSIDHEDSQIEAIDFLMTCIKDEDEPSLVSTKPLSKELDAIDQESEPTDMDQDVIKIANDLCNEGAIELSSFPSSITSPLPTDCAKFVREISSLFSDGHLDLSREDLNDGKTQFDLKPFTIFAPVTKKLTLNARNFVQNGSLQVFSNLTSLKIMSLGVGMEILSQIPDTVSHLAINESEIQILGDISQLNKLEYLDLSKNMLLEIPKLNTFADLKSVDLSSNKIRIFDAKKVNLNSAIQIDLRNNPIKDFSSILFANTGQRTAKILSDVHMKKRMIYFQK